MKIRKGYTLLELIVALMSASVLVVGLSSAIFIAAQGLGIDDGTLAQQLRADAAISRLLADVRAATDLRVENDFIEYKRQSSDGGGVETVRYYRGGDGDQLRRTIDGGAEVVVIPKVDALSFRLLTAELP